MNTIADQPKVSLASNKGYIASIIVLIIASFFAVSSQSFWIDEAYIGEIARQSDPASAWEKVKEASGSTLQMPLYVLCIWLWEKLAGKTEYALRALNIPFLILGVSVVLLKLRALPSVRRWFLVAAGSSPFLWAYMDEARPYVMQFAAACLILVALINISDRSSPSPTTFDIGLALLGAFLLCGSSLLGVVFTGIFGVGYIWFWLRRFSLRETCRRRDLQFLAVPTLPLFLILAFYYGWTLSLGVGASEVGKTNLQTMGFCLYELLGFAGLGPGRIELREEGLKTLPPYIAYLAAFGIVVVALMFYGICLSRKKLDTETQHRIGVLAFVVIASVALIFVLGSVKNFRVIGRHLIPVLPFILLATALLIDILWREGGGFGQITTSAYLCLCLASSICIRLSDRHLKDDYRYAAAQAKNAVANGEIVWWAADAAGAHYYDLFPSLAGGGGPAYFANNRDKEYLRELPEPTAVILSKADVFDSQQILRTWLSDRGYHLREEAPAFRIYRR